MTGADYVLRPVTYSDLVGWNEDDPSAMFAAMRDCLSHVSKNKPYRSGSLGLTTDDLMPLLEDAAAFDFEGPAAARRFFEERCTPFLIQRSEQRQGFVTGFFEPEVDVAAQPDSVFRYPFYRRPSDLVDLDNSNRPADLDPSYVFGRQHGGHIDAYPDRRQIDGGYLDGQGLEIAWARSKVDVFFTHVQGAARLIYRDGTVERITYDGKAGHPFSPIGRVLIDRGEIDAATVSMQSIRDWLIANPAKVDEILWHNRSYIFFRQAPVADMAQGPIAAAKVPLVAGRSLAVDRLIHTFGFPFFIRAQNLTHLDHGKPFARLMLALDTGSAIVGPARGDIFTGSGYDAGEQAGTIRHPADFHILVPKAAAARFV